MILTCDKCFTRYVVDSRAIPSHGRIVKCAKCGHSWQQAPQETEHTTMDNEDDSSSLRATISSSFSSSFATAGISAIPPGSGLPVIRVARTPPVPSWLKFLPLFTLCLLIMIMLVLYKDTVLRAVPELQPFYNIIGLYNTEGVALHDIALSKEEGGIYLYGKIVNNAADVRYVPAIRITILNSDKHAFAAYTLPAPGSRLEPTATYPIHSKLPAGMEDAAYVSVDTGNPTELLLR